MTRSQNYISAVFVRGMAKTYKNTMEPATFGRHLSEPPGLRHLRSGQARSAIYTLRASAAEILGNTIHFNFTDHTVAHSDRMTQILDKLISPIAQTDFGLSDDELIALYSACYLHDIGMQYERAGPFIERHLVRPWPELSAEERRDLLREHHAEISAQMVKQSAFSQSPLIGYQLTEAFFPSEIAALCASHTLSPDDPRYERNTRTSGSLRMPVLSALLRLADILDEIRGRAPHNKLQTLDLNLISLTHWWRNYYTREARFDERQRQIILTFEFPEARRGEFSQVIPRLQTPTIERELDYHINLLIPLGCGWVIKQEVLDHAYPAVREMPQNVFIEMERQLAPQKRVESEVIRQVSADAAREPKIAAKSAVPPVELIPRHEATELIVKLEELKEAIPADEYINKAHEVSEHLWAKGRRHSAWLLLYSALQLRKASVTPKVHLRVGLRLAIMLMDEEHFSRAVEVLSPLRPQVTMDAFGDEQKKMFAEVWAKCLMESASAGAVEALNEAGIINISKAEEFRVLADEWHFLQGELENVRIRGGLG